jgi:hypothetical protein
MCFLAYTAPKKVCSRCSLSFPWEAFVTQKHTPDGMGYWCRECRNTWWNEWHAVNKAPQRALEAAERKKERARLKALLPPPDKKPRNAEKHRMANAAYRLRHPERIPIIERKARSKYLAKHPELPRIGKQRYEARKRGLPDSFTEEQWHFALTYWQHCCAVCGSQESFWTTFAADHWIPLASPNCPGTVATNIIPLCHGGRGCNNSKNASEPHAWLVKRLGARKAAKIEKAITTYFAQVALVFADKAS